MLEKSINRIYKGKSPTKILNHRNIRLNSISNKNTKKFHIYESPKISLREKSENIEEEKSYMETAKKNNYTNSFIKKFNNNFNLDDIHEKNIKELSKFREKKNRIKMIFYSLTGLIYFSFYLLCIKILFSKSLPDIPPLGTSLFIICFNGIILSIFFINLDQINYIYYLNIEIIGDNLLNMIFNFLSILLIIKSLEKLNLITFILISNMNPIIISFLNIFQNYKRFLTKDAICYLLFLIISIFEFLTNNKISIICTFLLIAINTFFYTYKLKGIKNLHPYIIIFGISLIGISLSPIIMVLNKEILNISFGIISFTQYLIFTIISLALFFKLYFSSKCTHYYFGKDFQTINSIIWFFLFIIYSAIILKENSNNTEYIFVIISFLIGIYAIFRIDSKTF